MLRGEYERLGGTRARLLTWLAYKMEPLGPILLIPPGFEFDLSAPWYVRWALPRDHMMLPACLHDFARRQLQWPLWFTDLLFLDALRANGVREPIRTVSWLVVRTNNSRT